MRSCATPAASAGRAIGAAAVEEEAEFMDFPPV
jgi:hypothetical protein